MAGIDEQEGADARELAEEEAVNSALRFARRRAIGPYASEALDPEKRERALAAMVRAGHRFALARAIIDLKPGENPDTEAIINLRSSCYVGFTTEQSVVRRLGAAFDYRNDSGGSV